jgi:DNA-binding transcriptional LysR family regulator
MAKVAKPVPGKVSKRAMSSVVWSTEPADKDYPSAQSYLRLVAGDSDVQALVTSLAQAVTVSQHAKDILRASGLPLLPADDMEVAKDLARVAAGVALSPILLVRGDLRSGRPLQVADGYHRVCAGYHLGEDTEIPCRLVSIAPPSGD